LAEYKYRSLFPGVTHTQYLDDVTVEERNWMLQIHGMLKREAKDIG